MGPQPTTASPTPEPQLRVRRPAHDFFHRMEEEGHDLDEFRWMLRSPEGVSLESVGELALHLRTDVMTLLQVGIGAGNSFAQVDQALSRCGDGYRLGLVIHEA